jgi:hypothetical protein
MNPHLLEAAVQIRISQETHGKTIGLIGGKFAFDKGEKLFIAEAVTGLERSRRHQS